jgi:tape measure domain-containing protein
MEGGDLCMSNVEERIVRMKFDNATFANGVSSTMSQLQALNKALQLNGASQGLNEINNAVNNLNTNEAQNQVSALAQRFGALQIAAITALTNIVNKAVNAGLQLSKSLTIQPIIDGFREYETNLGSIQTILANTGLKGAEGLKTVNKALDELNHFSDQTIYNFSQMAKNIGTFTAAGLSLDVSTNAIKGIANLAAISGSNAEQASTAMYQLSQALAAGKVTLEDWNSVVNAGMGGKVFQDALIETARRQGIAVDSMIKKNGSFRSSLQEGWLTTGVLTETLSKFTGDLTADQLKSMGYTEQQIKGILEMGKTAVDAATKVKTMSQLLDTLREAVGSGWSKTWQIVFGDFDEAKELFTGVNKVLGGMISSSAEARNNLLQGWKDLGGRQALIEGIGNAFKALMAILKPIKDAFRQIFPATTAKQLYDLTVSFRNFMERLKIGEETANNLRRTFAGFFAILGIGWELIKAGAKFIFDLVGSLTSGSGGVLKFTASVGDFLVALHRAIKEGDAFAKFFEFLGRVIAIPLKVIKTLVDAFGNLFKNATKGTSAVEESVGGMVDSISPLERIGRVLEKAWGRILEIFSVLSEKARQVARDFVEWAGNVGAAISGVFQGGLNFDAILGAINTGLFAGLFLILKKFLGNIGDFLGGGGGIFDGVIDALDGLTGALQGMQNALNATALLAIALAIGVLTLSLIGLSDIDAAGLVRGSAAIAVMFTQLALGFAAFNQVSTGASALKVGVMSAGLILLATAIRILASSVEKLGSIEIEKLHKGLIAVGILLGTLVAASNRLNTIAPGIIRTSAGLVILAAAIRLLVESVEELGELNWQSLAKGLVGVGGLLASLALFTRLAAADKGGISQGAGVLLLSVALKILASALKDMTQFNWEEMGRGMAAIAVGLGLIVASINLLPEGATFKAAGVLIVASALKLIAAGVKDMSELNWGEIARGLSVVAGALISIAVALRIIPSGAVLNATGILIVAAALHVLHSALEKMANMAQGEIIKALTVVASSLILIAGAVRIMQGAVSGAAAVMIVALALQVLLPVLTTLGEMSWEEIIKGLVGLAGVFIIFGVAGLVLGPIVPVIFALAAGIALLGLAVLAAGVGVLAFATGLTILAAAGTASVAAIIGIVSGLVGLIPYVMEQIALGLVAFANVIAVSGPSILAAITTLMNAFLDAIIAVIPKIIQTIVTMLEQILEALVRAVPKMVDSGMKIIIGFLKGVANNMPQVVDQGVRIVIALLDGIGRNAGKIIQAAIDLVLNFMNGIADGIRNNATRVVDAGLNIASALIEGVVKGIRQLIGKAVEAALNVAKSMWDAVTGFFDIFSPSKKMVWMSHMLILGIDKGLHKYGHIAEESAVNMSENMIDSMGKTLSGLSAVLGKDLIDFNPTIAPVLDLSQVKKEATSLADILSAPSFDVAAAARSAQNANVGFEENRNNQESTNDANNTGDTYNYTQNNTSPKSLSEAEIYRQTKNLISRTKGDS